MKVAFIALKSIIKGIDPIDIEVETAWSNWNKAVAEHRKRPTITSQRKEVCYKASFVNWSSYTKRVRKESDRCGSEA